MRMAKGGRDGVSYTRVTTEEEKGFDVEQPQRLRTLFQANGTSSAASPVSGDHDSAKTKRQGFRGRLSHLHVRIPHVGSAVAAVSGLISWASPMAVPALAAGVVGAGIYEVHGLSQNLDHIAVSIDGAKHELHTMTHASNGEAYIQSVGPGVQSLAAVAVSLEHSGVVDKLANLDTEAVSELLRKLSGTDIEALASGVLRAITDLQQLQLQANVHFEPGVAPSSDSAPFSILGQTP